MGKIIAAFILLSLLAACGLTGKETTPPAANLYIINASPDAPAIDVAINNNTIAASYGYGKDSGYILTFPGTYSFKVSQSGAGTILEDDYRDFPAGRYYSFFMIDSFSQYKFALMEDKFLSTTDSTTFIRLLNFCPNSPTFRVRFTKVNATATKDTLTFASRTFNDQTSTTYTTFSTLLGGTYNFVLFNGDSTATNITLKDFGQIEFATGKHYTVYLKGLYGNTTTPLDTAILVR